MEGFRPITSDYESRFTLLREIPLTRTVDAPWESVLKESESSAAVSELRPRWHSAATGARAR